MLKLDVEIKGDVGLLLTAERRAGARSVKQAMTATAEAIKADWRGQIKGAGLGTRLGNTIRREVYPHSRPSLNTAALIYSRASKIVGAFERGSVIRAQNGLWLAVPLPAAGKGSGNRRLTPREWEQRRGLKLRFVYRRRGPSLLVADGRQNKKGLGVESRSKTGRGRATIPIFIMLPQVTLRKRLDLYAAVPRLVQNLPQRIVAGWGSPR